MHAGVNCVCNVCGSAHSCGGVVNGSFAIEYYYYYQWTNISRSRIGTYAVPPLY